MIASLQVEPGDSIRDESKSHIGLESRHILGLRVDCTHYAEAVELIYQLSRSQRGASVCVATVHMVMEAYDDPDYRRVVNGADLVTSDGVPLVWGLRLLGLPRAERVYGPTLTPKLCAKAEATGCRVGFLGGTAETLAALSRQLRRDFPKLDIVFSHAPPFRPLTPDEDASLVAAIEAAGVQILFVGLGCPKQERWMAGFRPLLEAPVLIGVGAAFDYNTGRIKRAPAWMQKSALEWLFRLLQDPKRLWKRYARNNPLFVYYLLCQKLGLRDFRGR